MSLGKALQNVWATDIVLRFYKAAWRSPIACLSLAPQYRHRQVLFEVILFHLQDRKFRYSCKKQTPRFCNTTLRYPKGSAALLNDSDE